MKKQLLFILLFVSGVSLGLRAQAVEKAPVHSPVASNEIVIRSGKPMSVAAGMKGVHIVETTLSPLEPKTAYSIGTLVNSPGYVSVEVHVSSGVVRAAVSDAGITAEKLRADATHAMTAPAKPTNR